MNYFQSLILSVVEGITEFLPISSTGHLILTSDLLQITQTDFVKTFEVTIQLGAIAAVIFLYRKTFLGNIKAWRNILVAFVPTAVVGLVLYQFIRDSLLGNSFVVSLALILGGIVLVVFELNYKEKEHGVTQIEKINYRSAFIIGITQSISVIPGVSRAAATIVGGLFLGLDRKTAVEFSFLLAVPTMFAATALDLYKTVGAISGSEMSLIAVGFFGAFITALVAIKFFINFIKKNNFISFGIYRIVVGVIFLLR
jgi:undecaprenyl-diphosphatase